MPLYDFQCRDCGGTFEVTLRFSEADRIPVCPKCESGNTKKQLSKIAVFVSSSSSGSQSSAAGNSCGTQSGFT